MNLRRYRAVVSVLASIGFVAIVAGAVGWYGWRWHGAANERFSEITPRYARLLGLQSADVPLRKAVLEAYSELRRWTYLASMGVDRAGVDLQQRVRQAAEAGGMSIVSSQILTVRTEAGMQLIPVSLTVEGSLQALQATILAMEKDTPIIFVDSITLRVNERSDSKSPQQISAVMGLVSIRGGG